MGNNSSLPASISNINISFEGIEKKAKLQVGPTASSPGPILFMVAATAVKFVTRLCPSSESSSTDTANTTIYHAIYAFTVFTIFFSTGRPSIVTLLICPVCNIPLSSFFAFLPKIISLETLMPPPVLPAQAPINIIITKMTFEKLGQRSKFSVAKPVVEIIEATVNATCRMVELISVYVPL